MVLRGCIGGSCANIQPTINFMLNLFAKDEKNKMSPNVIIDPLLFRKYDIKQAPCVVFAENAQTKNVSVSEGLDDNFNSKNIYKSCGAWSLVWHLKELNKKANSEDLKQMINYLEPKGGFKMLKKLIVLLLFLSIHLFAAETVYAWGYGDLLVETLKAVKYMFSIGEFRDFWKIAVLISMISAVLMMLTPNPDFLKLPKIFIFTMGIYALFVTAKIDVYVDDKADNTNSGVVTQVPWAVGYPLALFSALEYRIGATYETATSIPNGMKYSDSGFMTPISIFNQATSHKIVTPFLYQNLDNYIMECVMPDIENGYKDYRTLISNDNVWSYLGNTSPAIFMLYNDQDNNTSLKTCTEVYSSLNSLLTAYVGTSGEGMEYLGKSLGMLSSSAVSSKLGIANQYLSNSSKNASQLLLQTTAINMFSETFRSYAAMNGASVENAAFHSASAGQAASTQMVVSGILGSKYIPIMKGVLTAIIVWTYSYISFNDGYTNGI